MTGRKRGRPARVQQQIEDQGTTVVTETTVSAPSVQDLLKLIHEEAQARKESFEQLSSQLAVITSHLTSQNINGHDQVNTPSPLVTETIVDVHVEPESASSVPEPPSTTTDQSRNFCTVPLTEVPARMAHKFPTFTGGNDASLMEYIGQLFMIPTPFLTANFCERLHRACEGTLIIGYVLPGGFSIHTRSLEIAC
jgi:hypothetical protein